MADSDLIEHLETCTNDGCDECRGLMEHFATCNGCETWGHKSMFISGCCDACYLSRQSEIDDWKSLTQEQQDARIRDALRMSNY